MTDSMLGRTLGQFVLEKLLEQGGTARLYRAWDTHRSAYVTIRVLDASTQQGPDYAERFAQEAQAISRIRHPNIVRIYEHGSTDGVLYMAMQYVPGADLETMLRQLRQEHDRIPMDDAIRIVRQICAALDYAHSEGVIHRNVTSANIAINEDGTAVLSNFALALEDKLRGMSANAAHYIAPEQVISVQGAVPQSDLYAMGVVIYEMLTGRVPFEGNDAAEIARRHLSEAPPAPRSLNPDISPELEAVVLKALSKTLPERYPSGAALASAFEQAIQGAIHTLPGAASQSIADRVAQEMAAHPLPPPPAAVMGEAVMNEAPQVTAATLPYSGPYASSPPPAYPQQGPAPGYGTAPYPPARSSGSGRGWWVYGGVIGLVLLCLMLGVILALLSSRGDGGNDNNDNATDLAAGGGATATPVTPQILPTSTGGALNPTPTSIRINSPVPLPSATPLPLPSATQAPPPTNPPPPPTNPPIPTADPGIRETVQYAVEIHVIPGESLLIKNPLSANENQVLPMASLQLRAGDTQIRGVEWGISGLAPQQCVYLLRSGGAPQVPSVPCEEVGSTLERGEDDNLWSQPIQVEFNGEPVATCSSSPCLFGFSTFQSGGSDIVLLSGGVGLSDGRQLPPGEMQVEWYCTVRDLRVDQDANNWYCVDASNVRVLTFTAADFDAICQQTYSRADAFALQTGGSSTPAFNWQCYGVQ